ncbi:MAG: YHS domain-containing protein [Betaproteobacteria bacterium]|nr:MAG: YHS domain-containing protein [Betaproteobacteria bacterium]
MTRDPVCGMTVDPAKPGATVTHGGKTYYFCCKHCAARFEAEPEKYVQPAIDPVCGMKVEPANAAAEIEHGLQQAMRDQVPGRPGEICR